YRDEYVFRISKVVDKRTEGSATASHIRGAYNGAQRPNPAETRGQGEAAARAKELLAEAKGEGAVFSSLARDNSDGPTAPRGGDLGYFQEGVMTDAFNDFVFGNPVGSRSEERRVGKECRSGRSRSKKKRKERRKRSDQTT